MSEQYTPTTDEIIRCFTIPVHVLHPRKDGESLGEYLSRTIIEAHGSQMESEALAKAAHAEWYAKDLSMTLRNYHTSTRPEVVLALIAELRQERERASEAFREEESERLTIALGDYRRQLAVEVSRYAKAEAALSRAEETIEKVRAVAQNPYEGYRGESVVSSDELRTILATYDQQT